MLKRPFFNVFSSSALLLGLAFGCDRAPEIPPEIAAAHSVDYSAAVDGQVAHLKTESEFNDFIKNSPVAVVKFGAVWCPPCRALEPDLVKQAGYFEGRGVQYAEIDVDELDELSRSLGVQSIPDVRVYLDGRGYAQIVGYEPHTLANLIDALCEPAPVKSESSQRSVSTEPTPIDVDELKEIEASEESGASEPSPAQPQNANDDVKLEEELWPEE